MIVLQKNELALLHIMCNKKLTGKVCKLLAKLALFFTRRNLVYLDLIFNLYLSRVNSARKQHKLTFDKQGFAAECIKRILLDELAKLYKLRALLLLSQYLHQLGLLDLDRGILYVKLQILLFCNRKMSLALVNSPAIDTLQHLVLQGRSFISAINDQGVLTRKGYINILDNLPLLMKRRVRIPLGVAYFDYATCGGVCSKLMALIGAPTGGGKCLAYGTPILMGDGSVKQIQDIVIGDYLMGPSGNTVKVCSTTKGYGLMYRITPVVGSPFLVNSFHILTVTIHGTDQAVVHGVKRKQHLLFDISIKKYLLLPHSLRKLIRLVRVTVLLLGTQQLLHSPYFTGLAIGQCIKRPPLLLPTRGSLLQRRQFIAGLIAANGKLQDISATVTVPLLYSLSVVHILGISGFTVKSTKAVCVSLLQPLMCAILFVGLFARLPLQAGQHELVRSTHRYLKFTVSLAANADYYGFTLTGDGRYLHQDGIVTHNTMCATDLACAQARMNNLVMWFSYLQPFLGDIALRIVANFTGVSLSSIRNRAYLLLSVLQHQLLNASTAGLASNLVGVDFSTAALLDPTDLQDVGGVYSILKRIIKALLLTGRKVKFVILDWFGLIISKLAAYSNVDLSVNYRHFARTFLALLRLMMLRRDVFVMVFHQLNQKACDSKPTYIPNKTDFQDMRTLANNMLWCFLIGKRDELTGVCWFNTDKARRCRPSLQTIQMDGLNARFRKVLDYIPNRKGGFTNMKLPPPELQLLLDGRTADLLRMYSQ